MSVKLARRNHYRGCRWKVELDPLKWIRIGLDERNHAAHPAEDSLIIGAHRIGVTRTRLSSGSGVGQLILIYTVTLDGGTVIRITVGGGIADKMDMRGGEHRTLGVLAVADLSSLGGGADRGYRLQIDVLDIDVEFYDRHTGLRSLLLDVIFRRCASILED